MTNIHGELPAIFQPYECSKSIFGFLRRDTLKELRLSCKSMAEVVASPASHLFSRVYISANFADLETLKAISNDPRISRCVKELIWDISGPPVQFRRESPYTPETRENIEVCHRISSEYEEILAKGLDYETLLITLPRLPALNGVIFVDLMSMWITKRYNPSISYCYDNLETGYFYPPHYDTFGSPAMRQWRSLGIDGFIYLRRSIPSDTMTQLTHREKWVGAIRNCPDGFPQHELQGMSSAPLRALMLFLVAMERTGLQLRSYRFEASMPRSHRRAASQIQCNGIDASFFSQWDSVLASLSHSFRPLRRLYLTLDHSPGNQCADINQLLSSAENLETLHLRLYNRSTYNFSLCLPCIPNLKRLVLDNFSIERGPLENELLPWSFAVGSLQLLHFVRCMFTDQSGIKEIAFFRWLVGRDVSNNNDCCSGTISTISTNDPGRFDDDNVSVSWSDAGTDDDDAQPRVKFMDLEFSSEDDDEDEDYFPCTDEMWSRHMDAPFADNLEYVYFQDYHEAEVRAYEDDYIDEEGAAEDELPMPRLRAGEARTLPNASGESVELNVCGHAWGSDGRLLRIWVDEFHLNDPFF